MVVCMSSPLVISFGCSVTLFGTVAADLHVRVRLTPGRWYWQYVRNSTVLCAGGCFLWAVLWRVKWCARCLRTLLHLITPSYWSLAMKCSLLATCLCCVWVHKVWLSYCVLTTVHSKTTVTFAVAILPNTWTELRWNCGKFLSTYTVPSVNLCKLSVVDHKNSIM